MLVFWGTPMKLELFPVSFVPSVSFVRFSAVGLVGFLVQIAALAALTTLAHWTWLPATLLSVELAVIHNFFWHERWTWIDRTDASRTVGAGCSGSMWPTA